MSKRRTFGTRGEGELEASPDSQTLALSWITDLLAAGSAWLPAPILVPFVLGPDREPGAVSHAWG